MLDYKRIEKFFDNYPDGVISIVQADASFDLTKDVAFSLDTNSVTFYDIVFTRKVYGNGYRRKGTFMIPFHSILRVEYLTQKEK